MFYQKELTAIKRANRYRTRDIFSKECIDLASNDYLGLGSKKKLLKKTFKKIQKNSFSPKASMLVNGYNKIHKEFEDNLKRVNKFEDAVLVGSGFLANISLIETLVRRDDILFIDEEYHASGVLATNLAQGKIVWFNHNNPNDLIEKIELHKNRTQKIDRILIAIEGIYSMSADIAKKEIFEIAIKYNALLIVDEAHSSGVIGKNLSGIFDYYNLEILPSYIKMGTLGKAYGSYGAYILGSKEIIDFLLNRAKPIIYSTAPSIFDIAFANESLLHIEKNSKKISKKILKYQKAISKELNQNIDSLIIPIEVNSNQKALDIKNRLLQQNISVGAIRPPTVKKPIIRLIAKLDIDLKLIIKTINFIKSN
jgi:8-amino-7-oxononanoate synthase